MRLRTIAWALTGLLLAIVVVSAATLYWASHSETALRWGVDFASQRLPGKLSITGIHGSLLEPIRIDALMYEDNTVRAEAHGLVLDWFPMALLHDSVDVSRLQIQRARVLIKPQAASGSALPGDLRLPTHVRLAALSIGELRIDGAGTPLDLRQLAAAYEGGAQSHRLDLQRVSVVWGGPHAAESSAVPPSTTPSANELQLAAHLQLSAQTPFTVSGNAATDIDLADGRKLQLQADLSGTLAHIGADVHAALDPLRVDAVVKLALFDALPIASVKAHSQDVDVSQWVEGAPHTRLRIQVDAQQTGAEEFAGSIEVINAKPCSLEAELIPLRHATSAFTAEPRRLNLTSLALDLGSAGRFAGSASLTEQGLDSALTTNDFNLRGLHADLRETRLVGSLQAKVANESQSVSTDLRQANLEVQLQARHQSGTVEVNRLLARAGNAELSARGTLTTTSPNRYSAQGRLSRFDPARFGDFPSAAINGSFSVHGQLRPQWLAAVEYDISRSRFRQQPLGGRGRLIISPDRIRDADAQITLGSNRLTLFGALGAASDRLTFELDGRELGALGVPVSGALHASGEAQGTFVRPALTFKLEGRTLIMPGGYSIARIDAHGSMAPGEDPVVELHTDAAGLARETIKVDAASVNVTGSLSRHAIDLQAAAPDMKLTAHLEGGWRQRTRLWEGSLRSLETSGAHPFKLTGPVPLSVGKGLFFVTGMHVTYGETNLSIDQVNLHQGTISTTGQFTHLPAALLLSLNENLAKIESSLLLGGRWSLNVTDRANGRIELFREAGDLTVPSDPPAALGIERASADVRIVDDRVNGTLDIASSIVAATGKLETTLSQRDDNWGIAGNTPLRLQAHATAGSLKPVVALFAKNVTADGRVTLDVERDGPLSQAASGRGKGKHCA
jgi:translocation and assembly module TamB